MVNPLNLNNQLAWAQDENDSSGYFHTYDALTFNADDLPRKVHVFLPRNYSTSNHRYPVIYMNDGNTAFWPNGVSSYSWQVPNTLTKLYQKPDIQSVIIVAIHPLDRADEYLHVEVIADPLRPWTRKGGGLAKYSEYLLQVKEFIDVTYNTLKSGKDTTIIGSSHGGLAAFYTGCTHPQHFGNVGALSPSFWVGLILANTRKSLQESALITQLHPFLQKGEKHHPRIWIDWGLKRSDGFHNSFIEAQATDRSKEMIHLLGKEYGYILGKDLFKYEDRIGGHDEQAWAYRFGLILKTYYSA